jgi:hypothetical protein
MNHETIKLNELTIYSEKTGKQYVKMLVPEGWSSTIDRYEDAYGGYCMPDLFEITNNAPDGSSSIRYRSLTAYLDDELHPCPDGTVDETGQLHKRSISLEMYLEEDALKRLSGKQDLSFVRHIPFTSNEANTKKTYEKQFEKEKEKGRRLVDAYYARGISVYTYMQDGWKHYYLNSALLTSLYVVREKTIDATGLSEEDLLRLYPGCLYDEENDRYVQFIEQQIEWDVDQELGMDCLEEDYDFAYEQVFLPVVRHNVQICEDVWNDVRERMEKKDTPVQKPEVDEEEQRKIEAIWAEYRRWKAENDARIFDYVRNTQDEIAAIHNSSHEYSKKIHDKMNEQWSDTFRGDRRFVDGYGHEHVIHTDNHYAYKKGDTYVTSDSPLDKPFGFEELKKKKY